MSVEQMNSTNETNAEPAGSLLTDAAAAAEDSTQADTQKAEVDTKQEPEGAPESYEFKLPDGVDGGQMLDDFKSLAKEYNLPQDKAQGLIDLWQKHQAQTMEQWNDVKKSWVDEVRNDKEIGGKNFDETMQVCGRFLKDLNLSPDFMKYMDDYGLGNHPAFVKGIYSIALKTMEDKPVMSGAGPGTPDVQTRMQNLYSKST